jgi:hypothetical protein
MINSMGSMKRKSNQSYILLHFKIVVVVVVVDDDDDYKDLDWRDLLLKHIAKRNNKMT